MYQTHSNTSREAYIRLSDEASQLENVYAELIKSGNHGLTGNELAQKLNLPIGTISARITTLIRHKKVKRSKIQRRVNGRFSTVCFALNTTMGMIAQEAQHKRDILKALVKELLQNKNQDGSLTLSPLDVKRLEAKIK